jgi:hypothetical protein
LIGNQPSIKIKKAVAVVTIDPNGLNAEDPDAEDDEAQHNKTDNCTCPEDDSNTLGSSGLGKGGMDIDDGGGIGGGAIGGGAAGQRSVFPIGGGATG